MTKTTKQDCIDDIPDTSTKASLFHYLRWAETGEIVYVHMNVTHPDKPDFPSPEKLKLISKEISQLFKYPTWEDIKFLVDKEGETNIPSVFIEYNKAIIHGSATTWRDASYYYSKITECPRELSEGLARNSPVGECVSTYNGIFLVVNEKLADIYGYESVEEMLAIPDIAHAVYHKPDDRNRLVQIIKNAKTQEQGKKLNFQFIGRRKNEELVIISKDVLPHFYEDEIVFLYGYVTDITETSDDVEDLNPVFKCDLDGQRIIYANKSMANFLGYTQQNLKRMDLSEIFSKFSRPSWLEELYKSREIQDISMVVNQKDGSTEEVFLNVAMITAENGQNKNDIYIRGSLVSKLGKPVRKILIDELKLSLSAPEHGLNSEVQKWSVSAAREIAGEITIDHFSDGELSQFIHNIKLVYEQHENQECSKLKFLPNLKFSLEDKIRLDVINSLRFFSYRYELLRNAFTLTQLAALDFSEQDVIQRIHNKLLLAIDKDGELLFPSWQFDINSPNKVIDQLPQVLLALDETPITQLSWLMVPHDAFDGRKPYEVLKTGTKEDKQRVVSEASGVGGW
jgi:PAS domain S-box-containing protein